MKPRKDTTSSNPGQGPSPREPIQPRGVLISMIRLFVLIIIALLLVIPFTPFAGKMKRGIKEIVNAGRSSTEIVTREIERRVEVPVTVAVTVLCCPWTLERKSSSGVGLGRIPGRVRTPLPQPETRTRTRITPM